MAYANPDDAIAYRKKYYIKNKEAIQKKHKNYNKKPEAIILNRLRSKKHSRTEKNRKAVALYREKNKLLIDAKKRIYYQQNKEKILTQSRKHYHENLEQNRARSARYTLKNSVAINAKNKLRIKKERAEIFRLEDDKCKCCGETDPIYFQIDHVNNDGGEDRKKNNGISIRISLEKYLKTPERFQLLCANCNIAKHLNGGKLYKPKKKKAA
jgi:hypothetical protein